MVYEFVELFIPEGYMRLRNSLEPVYQDQAGISKGVYQTFQVIDFGI